MKQQWPPAGLFITGNILVVWTIGYPVLYAASFYPGAESLGPMTASLFFPWLVGVIVLGVLYVVQR